MDLDEYQAREARKHYAKVGEMYEATYGQAGGPIPDPPPVDERFDNSEPLLPTDKEERKERPLARGVLDYFPLALAEVAHVSYVANEQHNPGEPMHWARGKSTDHADCIVRHLIERGHKDTDGLRHTAKVAWRALALLQEELEKG